MNEAALADARAIDARRAAGETLGPLAGVPVVIKEAMDFVGLPSTGGWAPLSSRAGGFDLIPSVDAPVVARLKAAGAVILGKTNIPAFSFDGARANTSWDGPTYNAVNRDICPGASSSGTATAIAASFAVVGLAEETGGSIQNPGAAQSLVSVKPTFALIPNTGVAPLAGSTRDVVGPHARTVRDAAILLDVLAGYTPADPKTVAAIGNLPAGGYTSKLSDTALAGKRLGLYGAGWRTKPISEETATLYAAAIEELKMRGAVLVDDPFAGTGFSALTDNAGFDSRGLESIVFDFDNFLRRMGPGTAATSFKALAAMLPSDPFGEDGPLGRLAKDSAVVRQSLLRPDGAAGPRRVHRGAHGLSRDVQPGDGRQPARRAGVPAVGSGTAGGVLQGGVSGDDGVGDQHCRPAGGDGAGRGVRQRLALRADLRWEDVERGGPAGLCLRLRAGDEAPDRAGAGGDGISGAGGERGVRGRAGSKVSAGQEKAAPRRERQS